MATETRQLRTENMVIFYKRKAQSLFMQVQAINRALDLEHLGTLTEAELNVRLESFEQLCTKFNLAYDNLEASDIDEIGGQLRISFDELVVTLRSRILHEITKRQTQLLPPTSSTLRHDQRSKIMQSRTSLPDLLVFGGNYTEYTHFFSTFSTIIGTDPKLTNVEKLQHLRSSLRGAALDTIRSLEISSSNYNVAIELLEKRFNKKRLIFQAHITEMLGLTKIDSSLSSAVKLRELLDKVNAILRALQTIGNTEQIAGCILVHTLLQKLDSVTQHKWEETAPLDVIPSYEQFMAFLEKRCQKLENVEHSRLSNASRVINANRKSFAATNLSNGCVFCDDREHAVYSCSRFSKLTPLLRLKESKRLSLCLNCLRSGHQLSTCNAGLCHLCGAKHHSLLHFEINPSWKSSASAKQNPIQTSTQNTPSKSHCTLATVTTSSSPATMPAQNLSHDVVLLATAVVNVKTNTGTWVPCRVLLDSGSQLHIITSRLDHQLQLHRNKTSDSVSGLGKSEFVSDGFSVNIELRSQNTEYSTLITALVAPSIMDKQPNYTLNISSWYIPYNIRLADHEFYKRQRIDMLIGASLFYELLCVLPIKVAHTLPLLQKTRLGWVVAGCATQQRATPTVAGLPTIYVSEKESFAQLEQLVRRWELKRAATLPVIKCAKGEVEFEEHFKAKFVRLKTGDYTVRLPTKSNVDFVDEFDQQAFSDCLSLEAKLVHQSHLKVQYATFIHEYLTLEQMLLVIPNKQNLCKYFMPNQCVLNGDSTTTKLGWVVFDGAAASSTFYSLNDVLMMRPIIQSKLFDILLRLRTFAASSTGYICEIYRYFCISEPDSYMQCILWRDIPQQEIQIYRLDTVTYGNRFVSVRLMHQLAFDEQQLVPNGSEVLQSDFYVDDLITAGRSVEAVIEIRNQVTNLLAKGHFKLPVVDIETSLKFKYGTDINKATGLTWDPVTDRLLFAFSPLITPTRHYKRSVLSTISRLYDPLALIDPIILETKIFLQQLLKVNFNRSDQWQRISYYNQMFWARWRKEYLTLLLQRSKWRCLQKYGICVNDVVLVKDENLPPLKWPLARVIKLVYGSEGVLRFAELKTTTEVIRRAIRNLCPLPNQDEVESLIHVKGGEYLVTQPRQRSAKQTRTTQ